MYVCLFDIDGTLIDAGGAGEAAMKRVLAEEFGITEITGDIPAAGRTDAAITQDLFQQHDMPTGRLSEFRDAYFDRLGDALHKCQGQVLPGVPELLEMLAARDDVALGLLTGNFESSAWAKLDHYGLTDHFDFGAFGDVHENRDDVARVAMKSVHNRHTDVDASAVWVLGDTPADIRCARAVSASVVAVATGIFDRDQLDQHQPDVLLDSFATPGEFLSCIA